MGWFQLAYMSKRGQRCRHIAEREVAPHSVSVDISTDCRMSEERLNFRVNLNIKHVQDFRNYKVSFEKAANVLSFHPQGDVRSIVGNLLDNMEKFQDWDNPQYSNIQTFQKLENGIEVHAMVGAA